jgi:hypothetical protein
MKLSKKMAIAVFSMAVVAMVVGQSTVSVAQGGLDLPINATCTACVDQVALEILQPGFGPAIFVASDNSGNTSPIIWSEANSPATGGSAIFGLQRGFSDSGSFGVDNTSAFGKAVFGFSNAQAPVAEFVHTNPSYPAAAFVVSREGDGFAATFRGGSVEVIGGDFITSNPNLSVPDYVFADDYDLMSLDELSAFIAVNSHLPNVPSASDIAADGLNVSQFTLSILEKVEELTLHTIALNDVIEAQQEQIEALIKLVHEYNLTE